MLLGSQRRDQPSLVALHADHVVDDALDAAAQRNFAQILSEQDGVRVIRVVEQPLVLFAIGRLRRAQLVGNVRGRACQIAVVEIDGLVGLEASPDVHEPHAIELRHVLERMVVVMRPDLRGVVAPVHELDAVLERGVSADHELPFVDLEKAQRALEIVESGFAHADDADVFGLDEGHAGIRYLQPRQQPFDVTRAHPTGGATPQDHDILDHPAHEPIPAFSGPSHNHPVIA